MTAGDTFLGGRVTLWPGDSREVLAGYESNSFDSIVCDPPYALVSIQKWFGKPGSAPAKDVYGRGAAGFMGKQWGMARKTDGVNVLYSPQLISEWFDVNIEGEYRYSKMMSFFLRFNNIASQRYYRWYNYPSQRFSFMIGVTFIPF